MIGCRIVPYPRQVTPDHDPCVSCGGPVTRHRHEAIARYVGRQTCAAACRRIAPPCREKQCPICGGIFTQREGEPVHAYRKRRTCGVECFKVLQSHQMMAVHRRAQFQTRPQIGHWTDELEPVNYAGGFGRAVAQVAPELGSVPHKPFLRTYGVRSWE